LAPRRRLEATRAAASSPPAPNWALLFDCDGVIVETEELHRRAYNGAFEAFGLRVNGEPVVWSVAYYDQLQNTVLVPLLLDHHYHQAISPN
jgi:hypothetical protein